jgi:hypothetical protein
MEAENINEETKKVKTISTEEILKGVEDLKSTYDGPDSEQCVQEIDMFIKEFREKHGQQIPVGEAYKLKRAINKSITYGGMDARQFQDFCKMGVEDWSRLRKEYDEWIRRLRIFGTLALCVWLAVGAGSAYFFEGWLKAIGVVIMILALYELAKRVGHREGYVDGYEAGRAQGLNKAFGISNETAEEIRERSIEMELDERMIRAIEKTET